MVIAVIMTGAARIVMVTMVVAVVAVGAQKKFIEKLFAKAVPSKSKLGKRKN